MRERLRIISYGGGVQSSALVVLAAQGKLDEVMGGPVTAALFANVGDDSEHPDTLHYVRSTMSPFAESHGIELKELTRTYSRGDMAGKSETLLGKIRRLESSVPIPMRMERSGAPGNRTCTFDFKIAVIARELKDRGATAESPALVAIGISTDEWQRANRTRNTVAHEEVTYPLLDLNLSRSDCQTIIADAGLPVPPKSSCWFCPFHTAKTWSEMRRDRPDLFWQAVQLESDMIARRRRLGKDAVYLTDKLEPLDVAIPEAQPALFGTSNDYDFTIDEDGSCDTGYCFV